MSLDSIVNITINLATKTPSQRGFGTPLIVAYHTEYVGRVRTYSSASELVADGFDTAHPVYRAFQVIKSQAKSPPTVKVGRRATASNHTVTIAPTVTTIGAVYAFDVVGPTGVTTPISYTVVTATVAAIVAGLVALVNPITGVDATDSTTHMTVTDTTNGDHFQLVGLDHTMMTVTDTTADPGLAADLDAIYAADTDWYGFAIDSHGELEIKAAAAWAEAKKVLHIASTCDSGCQDPGVTTDLLSDLVLLDYARTATLFHSDYGNMAAFAWLGALLPTTPGSETWAFKSLAGVSAVTMTTSAELAVRTKSGNTYTMLAGNPSTLFGVTSSGEYIDVTRLSDWTYARLQEQMIFLLQNNRKIPLTDPGAQAVRGTVLNVLTQGVRNGGYSADPQPECTVPKVADISVIDRANRHLPDVEFSATLAGAIHTVAITGNVSV